MTTPSFREKVKEIFEDWLKDRNSYKSLWIEKYGGKSFSDAILTAAKECLVPEEIKRSPADYNSYFNEGWNKCRKQVLEAIDE